MSLRKPVIKKGFAGVSDSDFVKRRSSKPKGANGEPLYTPEQKHKMFLDRLNTWLRANCGQLIDILQQHDKKGCGLVTKDQFCESLLILKAAELSREELSLVIKFLTEKPTRSKVDYLSFARGVNIPFPVRDDVLTEDIKLSVRDISNPPCPKCKLKFPPTERPEVRPRFLLLTLELIQFETEKVTPPCNFVELVTASLTVFGVKQLIQDRFGHSLLNLEVYQDKHKSGEPLPNNWTLHTLGYKGGVDDDPEDVMFYYDVHVTPAFYSCPLLLTDHYFAKHTPNTPGTTVT